METNFNFKSKPCTSREQSERLLALGLKKETADMALVPLMEWDDYTSQEYFTGEYVARTKEDVERYNLDYIPAWSLHRMIKLAYGNWDEEIVPIYLGNSYDMLIGRIEFQVKQEKFNKEYLENGNC